MIEFTPFPKIPRLKRGMLVTEKIDGTNAQIYITEDGDFYVGSRKRWIEPDAIAGKGSDNFGFAAWAHENREELLTLGPGRHFGEWWGKGIQRGYGLDERRFSLFNVSRWDNPSRPACCHVVPVLFDGGFDATSVDAVLRDLAEHGSYAAPGFMQPEGVIVFHKQSGNLYKQTFENDAEGKERAA